MEIFSQYEKIGELVIGKNFTKLAKLVTIIPNLGHTKEMFPK